MGRGQTAGTDRGAGGGGARPQRAGGGLPELRGASAPGQLGGRAGGGGGGGAGAGRGPGRHLGRHRGPLHRRGVQRPPPTSDRLLGRVILLLDPGLPGLADPGLARSRPGLLCVQEVLLTGDAGVRVQPRHLVVAEDLRAGAPAPRVSTR